MSKYSKELLGLQIELVQLQRHVIAKGERVLVILEGRDTAGKDGAIKRITEHMSPRETRVVALGPPSDRDRASWYFQRYTPYLPASGEIVLFNRSWYNRAGVEPVMGFCTETQTQHFFDTVGKFEQMIQSEGIVLLKYYLDISRDEQKKRLKDREKDPLKQWKLSPVDAKAAKLWNEYTEARDRMFEQTHTAHSPWVVVMADDKKAARLNLIRHLLMHVDHDAENLIGPDPDIVFEYSQGNLSS